MSQEETLRDPQIHVQIDSDVDEGDIIPQRFSVSMSEHTKGQGRPPMPGESQKLNKKPKASSRRKSKPKAKVAHSDPQFIEAQQGKSTKRPGESEETFDLVNVVLKKSDDRESYGINVVHGTSELGGQHGMVLTTIAPGKLLEKWSICNLPASKSISAGDVIVAINGVSAANLDLMSLRNAREMQLTIAHITTDNCASRDDITSSFMTRKATFTRQASSAFRDTGGVRSIE